VLIVDGDVLKDIQHLEDRSKFIAVMQGALSRQAASPNPSV